MRKPVVTLVTAVIGLTTGGCDPAAPVTPETAALELRREGFPRGRTSVSSVLVLADGRKAGASVLRRSPRGLDIRLQTSSLEPAFAYTGWWFAFEAPQHCSPPACSEDDVLAVLGGAPNPYELTILGPADGMVATATGQVAFAGQLAKGDVSTLLIGDGLDDPLTAEVWLIVRSHGPRIPGRIAEQLGSVDGGCFPGDPNEGLCVDVQVSVHQP